MTINSITSLGSQISKVIIDISIREKGYEKADDWMVDHCLILTSLSGTIRKVRRARFLQVLEGKTTFKTRIELRVNHNGWSSSHIVLTLTSNTTGHYTFEMRVNYNQQGWVTTMSISVDNYHAMFNAIKCVVSKDLKYEVNRIF